MKMKIRIKRFIASALLCGAVCNVFAFSEYEAKAVVKQFYDNVKIIAEEKYPSGQQTDRFVVARNNALGLCYSNSINLPNEFAEFNFETNDPFLQASAYIKRLFDFAVLKRPVVTIKSIQAKALEEIKSTKSENSKNFYEVVVEKEIKVGYTLKKYTDYVKVFAENGKIVEIANESGGGTGESIISLRSKAAELFANKRYDEAFDMYLKIINKDPQQGDAYYRLGLMSYHKKGCDRHYRSGKERRQKAYEYMEKAYRNSSFPVKGYAEHVLYYMLNGAV